MPFDDNQKFTEAPGPNGIYPASVAAKAISRYDIFGKIALVDADLLDGGTRHPNLVIMKLSGYFKGRGCDVRLIESWDELYHSAGNLSELNDYYGVKNYDAIYISKVFDFTKVDRQILQFDNVFFGGTGFYFDFAPKLPYEIEHYMPDYHVYDQYIEHDTRKNKERWYKDYLYFSIGFATRGCFRQCDFCVNHSCKTVEFHSHISEWYDSSRPYIYLWDDNLFGYARWREVLNELIATGKPFKFKQGIDMRLMTAEKAQILNTCKYYSDYIFAFDHIEDAPIIKEKLKLWRTYCDKPTKLYVLSGYDGQDEKEIISVFERIRILMEYNCLPYIMRHERYLNSPYKNMFIQIARWCNQPQFFKKISFREFCEQNQRYMKNQNHLSVAYKTMLDFEAQFPDIAAKYFDMKYLEQPYVIQYKKACEQRRKEQAEKKSRLEAEKQARKIERERKTVERKNAKKAGTNRKIHIEEQKDSDEKNACNDECANSKKR